MWATGARRESLDFLYKLTERLLQDLPLEAGVHDNVVPTDERLSLLARCFFKQGQWQVEMHEHWGSVSINLIVPRIHF